VDRTRTASDVTHASPTRNNSHPYWPKEELIKDVSSEHVETIEEGPAKSKTTNQDAVMKRKDEHSSSGSSYAHDDASPERSGSQETYADIARLIEMLQARYMKLTKLYAQDVSSKTAGLPRRAMGQYNSTDRLYCLCFSGRTQPSALHFGNGKAVRLLPCHMWSLLTVGNKRTGCSCCPSSICPVTRWNGASDITLAGSWYQRREVRKDEYSGRDSDDGDV